MARIEFRQLSKRYGAQLVVPGVDLTVHDGEFLVFVGPSGCGKSTLLRMVAGLEEITSGDLYFDGERVNDVASADRGAAMVFQSYALYPHMTVAENMGFALRMSGRSKAEREALVAETAERLQLTELLLRYPRQLSGGQRQRVAIGRAIVRRPKVFLFDEPLSNLDAALRVQMRIELARLHAELGTTMIYVTHDQTEAMTLGNRIAVFNRGRVEQVGEPMALYHQPANRFVAEFLGSPRINLLPYQPLDGGERLRLADPTDVIELDAATLALAPQLLQRGSHLGLRPEALELAAPGTGIPARVQFTENLGDVCVVHLSSPVAADLLTVKLPATASHSAAPRVGDAVSLRPLAGQALVFDAEGLRQS
jgi:ABC-type sugar transport system ATPase subunit